MMVLRNENGELKTFVWVYGFSPKTRIKLVEAYKKEGATAFIDKDTRDGFWVDFNHYDH